MKAFLILQLILLLSLNFKAQEIIEEIEDEEEGLSFFIGLNIGAYKANKKTAVMYNGGYSYHQNGKENPGYFGANYYFNEYNTKIVLDQYFKYDYEISTYALPDLMRYRTAYNIGGHAGINISESMTIYGEINIIKLKVEDFFSVEIDNPNDPTLIEPEIELIPVFGEESRTNINLGIQTYFYNEAKIKSYFNFFGNVNTSKIDENYFVINGIPYQIRHNNTVNGQINGVNNFVQNQTPSGVGYGGGAGIGIKYKFNDQFTFDFNYYANYSKVKMYEDLQPFGLNHAFVARIIWG